MTQAVAEILEKLQQLSAKERAELRSEILERTSVSGDLTDDDFAALAAASFRALDEEESSVPERGEVWLVDFGITQKVRPALVISVPYSDADRALIGVVPHTTETRGSQFEVPIRTGFLLEGAFLVQGIQPVPPKYFVQRLGALTSDQLDQITQALFSLARLAAGRS